ncbi:MAG: Nre family DNA repair protein [archaeon GB-1867-005]|nr:Nre family DNA repair protein [Candidatus Culexmicrobium cathedralense]
MPMSKSRKFVKIVKKKIPWIQHVLDNVRDALDLNLLENELKIKVPRKSMCIYCRGTKNLCGKSRCPVIIKMYSYIKIKPLIEDLQLEGSSPPAVFIGRYGYPRVYAGPLVPPLLGDTGIYDYPEKWLNMNIDQIVDMRLKLIRGKFLVNVKKFEDAGKLMDLTLELALSANSVETDVQFKKKPSKAIVLDDQVQPMGPSAPLKKLEISNSKWDKRLEKAFYDYDLKASEAILELHKHGVPVSRIQRAFSVGAFGLRRLRRLVPTRWSITAVDSIISREIRDEIVKRCPPINEYRVYEAEFLGNKFIVMMMPEAWSYELIEAWYPGSAWNPSRRYISIGGDWEGYAGRTTYAKIGGCYYAARLAVTEYLSRERRQAAVIVLREAYPDYILPLGVWSVRESVRSALRSKPIKFDTLEEALRHISARLKIRMRHWIETSELLKRALLQKKITRYLTKGNTF